nr:MAG TPA: Protein of unknown function (DUF551) [Caudoviricetes sp.]
MSENNGWIKCSERLPKLSTWGFSGMCLCGDWKNLLITKNLFLWDAL